MLDLHAHGHNLVKCRDRVARPNLTGIHCIIVEIFLIQYAVFIADQTIARHLLRVKLHLNFHVLRNRHERAIDLFDQQLLGFSL